MLGRIAKAMAAAGTPQANPLPPAAGVTPTPGAKPGRPVFQKLAGLKTTGRSIAKPNPGSVLGRGGQFTHPRRGQFGDMREG